ncbi:MAG: EamA family transporter RarD [Gammaproteobacteria bacterium]|nr:EamA family transporter RarD [Gammaproteobacteria bacterium]
MSDTRDGVIAGLIAYVLWGLLPIYFKAVVSVAPLELLMQRIIWAVPFGALIILLRRQWPEVRRALAHRSMLLWLSTAALFVAVNWYIYILAVQQEQIFQASLGYYINPLLYVLAGVLLFGEKLRVGQISAVALATIGVLVLTFSGGQFPALALAIGSSFTVYGVIRKRVVIGGMPGLFIETLVLLPIAMVWLGWMANTSDIAFGSSIGMTGLLLLAGPVTVVPLLFFALAARRLPLSTVGFMQFIAPTMQFFVALYYGEVFTTAHLICFACIWTAVLFFSADALQQNRRRNSAPAT